MQLLSSDSPITYKTIKSPRGLFALANPRERQAGEGIVYEADKIPISDITDADEAIKQYKLEHIEVALSTGKVLYADKDSRNDISHAIQLMESEGVDSQGWKTVNGIKSVTLAEFKEALKLGLIEKGKIVGVVK